MIRIKPHHFIDIIVDLGAGKTQYQPASCGHALHEVAPRLLESKDVELEIEQGIDDICLPCSHNVRGECDDLLAAAAHGGMERKHDYNLQLDQRWCGRLGLEQGQRINSRDFVKLLGDNCADLADIYRELPAERVKEKRRNIEAGAKEYLTTKD